MIDIIEKVLKENKMSKEQIENEREILKIIDPDLYNEAVEEFKKSVYANEEDETIKHREFKALYTTLYLFKYPELEYTVTDADTLIQNWKERKQAQNEKMNEQENQSNNKPTQDQSAIKPTQNQSVKKPAQDLQENANKTDETVKDLLTDFMNPISKEEYLKNLMIFIKQKNILAAVAYVSITNYCSMSAAGCAVNEWLTTGKTKFNTGGYYISIPDELKPYREILVDKKRNVRYYSSSSSLLFFQKYFFPTPSVMFIKEFYHLLKNYTPIQKFNIMHRMPTAFKNLQRMANIPEAAEYEKIHMPYSFKINWKIEEDF